MKPVTTTRIWNKHLVAEQENEGHRVMQTIVAGLMALTAMGASIISDVDPVTTVVRGSIAFVIGMVLAGVWTMVVLPQDAETEDADDDDDEVESEDSTPAPSSAPAKRLSDEVEDEDDEDEDQAA